MKFVCMNISRKSRYFICPHESGILCKSFTKGWSISKSKQKNLIIFNRWLKICQNITNIKWYKIATYQLQPCHRFFPGNDYLLHFGPQTSTEIIHVHDYVHYAIGQHCKSPHATCTYTLFYLIIIYCDYKSRKKRSSFRILNITKY